jgi:ATP-binding cassette subfamily B protein
MKVSRKKAFRWLLRAFARHPLALCLIAIGILCGVGADIAVPIFTKKLFDALTNTNNTQIAFFALTSLFGLYGISWIAIRLKIFTINWFEPKIGQELQVQAYQYIIGHSQRFFADNFVGSLTRKITKLGHASERIFDELTFTLIPAFLVFFGSTISLLFNNPFLAYFLLGASALFMTINQVIVNWKRKLDDERSAAETKASGILSDTFSNHSAIMLFTGQTQELQTFNQAEIDFANLQTKSWNRGEVSSALQHFFAIIIECTMLAFGIFEWSKGLMTIGDIALIQSYTHIVFWNISGVGRSIKVIGEQISDTSEILEILETPHEIQDNQPAQPLTVTKGEITFNNVSFAFKNTQDALTNFNLSITAKEKIALVGPSGAGKSTITKLLLRYYDINKGTISIDDQNIAKVTQNSLRDAIAYVPQEALLFHRTILENIRYGKRDATDEEVYEAARKARCHDFISKLPDGYGSFVGERGVKLSGGERQRIAIARAIIKNAPILILDEATASLDSQSEKLIHDALHELMQNKTVLVIAHRLSTIMEMDRIVVIENGTITATGTHEELLKKTGTYQQLWNIQAGGYQ